jgi:hypothetical protein
MHFTNARSISKTSVNINAPKGSSQQTVFGMNRTFIQPKSSLLNNTQSVSAPSQIIDNSKQMLWGAPFWYFFHTIADKTGTVFG